MLSDISNRQQHQTSARNGSEKGKINNKKSQTPNVSSSKNSNKRQQNTKPKKTVNTNSVKAISDHPSYKFYQHYEKRYLTMFPYLDMRNLYAEDEIDFTNSIRFPRNNAMKYSKPLSLPVTNISNTNEVTPIEKVLKETRHETHFIFGDQQIHIEADGTVGFKPVVELPMQRPEAMNTIVNTPSGSKRPIDHVDGLMTFPSNMNTPIGRRLLMNNSTPLSLQKQVISSVTKKKKYEKLDNSRVISARAIMKMVDDSLISSDSELYSNLYTNSLSSIDHKDNRSNNLVNINAEDIDFAKWGDIENEDENTDTPSTTKTINMHDIVVNNNLRNFKK